jgi:hypothetical protein
MGGKGDERHRRASFSRAPSVLQGLEGSHIFQVTSLDGRTTRNGRRLGAGIRKGAHRNYALWKDSFRMLPSSSMFGDRKNQRSRQHSLLISCSPMLVMKVRDPFICDPHSSFSSMSQCARLLITLLSMSVSCISWCKTNWSIFSYLELAMNGPLDKETRENLSMSHAASKNLLFTINDLLVSL